MERGVETFAARIGERCRGIATAGHAADLARAAADIAAYADEEAAALSVEVESRVVCAPGCSACCTVSVAVLVPEAVAIANWVAADREAVAGPLSETAEKVRWMEDGERIRRGIYCPFLDRGGCCGIYAVRPLVCRSITSTDADACRAALASAGTEEEVTIEVNLLHRFIYDTAFLALVSELERRGLDSRSFELTAAVSALIREPGKVETFLRGSRFQPWPP